MFYNSLREATYANLNKTVEGRFYLWCKDVCERQALKGRFFVGVKYRADEEFINLESITELLNQAEIEVSQLKIENGYICCYLNWLNSTKKNLVYKKGSFRW